MGKNWLIYTVNCIEKNIFGWDLWLLFLKIQKLAFSLEIFVMLNEELSCTSPCSNLNITKMLHSIECGIKKIKYGHKILTFWSILSFWSFSNSFSFKSWFASIFLTYIYIYLSLSQCSHFEKGFDADIFTYGKNVEHIYAPKMTYSYSNNRLQE